MKLSTIINVFKAFKLFGPSPIVTKGIGALAKQMDDAGNAFTTRGLDWASDFIKSVGMKDMAFKMFSKALSEPVPARFKANGFLSEVEFSDVATALAGTSALAALGLTIDQLANSPGGGSTADNVDLSTGVEDFRAEVQTGGKDFQYGALTLELGGPNSKAHYEGTFQPVSISVDSETRNAYGTVYGDVITSRDDVNQGNYIDGGEGNDRLEGGGGNDMLIGGKGDDTLRGGRDDDLLSGGEGADRLEGGDGEDTADYSETDHGVTVDLGAGTGKGGHAEDDTLSGIENVIGGKHDDILIGDDAANALLGAAGNDTLRGGAGDDLMLGGDGDDILEGGAGSDELFGGSGADVLDGGDGEDTTSYGGSTGGVAIDLAAGTAHGGDAEGDVLRGIEHVIGSDYDDVLTGDDRAEGNLLAGGAGNDALYGRGGGDLLQGGAGADIIDGGDGGDSASYQGSEAGVDIDLAAGTAKGGDAEGDVLRSIEHLVGSDHTDTLRGDDGTNVIGGGGGNDLIEGRAGADALSGGAGNDTVDGGEGQDLLFGNAGNDRLIGGAGNDVLAGGAGADLIEGGEGQDAASYADSTSAVQIDLAARTANGGDATGDTLVDIELLVGSKYADRLFGNDQANWLSGGGGVDTLHGRAGDDVLTGGAGADLIDGGDGIDIADYADAASGVTVDLATGRGTGSDAEGDWLSNVENLSGSAHDDVLRGNAGGNHLYGGAGNDLLEGGAGADTLDGGAGIDTADYSRSGSGVAVDLAAGRGAGGSAEGDRLIDVEAVLGSDHADALTGDAGANRLVGGAGDDTLDGGDGDDVLVGGAGADTIRGGTGYDTVDYSQSAAGVVVDLESRIGRESGGAADQLESIENVVGSDHSDHVSGSADANRLSGGNGGDILRGFDGDDVLDGGAGGDRLDGGAGIDTAVYSASSAGVRIDLVAGTSQGGDATGDTLVGIENLIGSAHADTLTGDVADNLIEGGAGADVIDAGEGNDTASYAGSAAGVTVDLSTGAATGGDAQGDRLSGLENLIGSVHADRLLGNAAINHLQGGAGDDVLVGGEGADRLDGGAGIDTADYSAAQDRVVVGLNVNPLYGPEGGVGYEGEAHGDRLYGIENVTGSAYADLLHGDEGANRLDGGRGDDHLVGAEGDDWLIGGEGADRLEGGAGTDTADYSGAAARIVVGLNVNPLHGPEGGVGYEGEAHGDRLLDIENLVGSAHGDLLHGDDGANRIDGGKGDDVLVGAGGADTLDGGEGSDTASYAGSSARIEIDLLDGVGRGGEAEGDRLSGIENLLGTSHDDLLLGDAEANRIEGGDGGDTLNGRAGDDVLVGGEGGDWLDGGDGIDTADYSAAKGRVVVGLNVNTAWHADGGAGYEGEASGDRLFNVENLIGSAHGDLLHGDDGANRIDGGAGDDHLVGGAGDDRLIGGAGADRLEGGDGVDTVDYSASNAAVTIYLTGHSSLGGHAQGDVITEVENAIGSDLDDILSGSSGNNRLEGGKGNDWLSGGYGDDRLVGGEGADTLHGNDGHDVADYSGSSAGIKVQLNVGRNASGNDYGRGWGGDAEGDILGSVEGVIGSAHADTLIGDHHANVLEGGNGNDLLEGWQGNDTLIGGGGNDVLAGKTDDDHLDGGDGDDVLWGDEGNDWVVGGAGADEIRGGTGTDTADYSSSTAGVTIDIANRIAYGGHADGDALDGIDSLIGSAFDDALSGDDGGNYLQGNAGNDVLTGHGGNDALYSGEGDDKLFGGSGNDQFVAGAGDDWIEGGTGDDHMQGDAGADTFAFTRKDGAWGSDHIWDFSDDDVIALDAASHAELGNVLAGASQNGADAVLNFQNGSITLHGKQAASLSTEDFAIL